MAGPRASRLVGSVGTSCRHLFVVGDQLSVAGLVPVLDLDVARVVAVGAVRVEAVVPTVEADVGPALEAVDRGEQVADAVGCDARPWNVQVDEACRQVVGDEADPDECASGVARAALAEPDLFAHGADQADGGLRVDVEADAGALAGAVVSHASEQECEGVWVVHWMVLFL